MSKNKNAKKTDKKGPGRPSYQIKWPTGKFTFTDLMIANEVNPETGKGKFCTKLTLRKGIDKDMFHLDKNGNIDKDKPRRDSLIVKTDETRPPESGLGRNSFVYVRRSKLQSTKSTKSKGTSKATVDYEAQKAALLAPVVDITPPEPVSTPDPVVTAPEPVTAEVAVTQEPVTS